ncbi:GNAT family N-acetyltransferase [Streptomyces rectiverticillatus]|uniref:GNAT family N-acetyltransferase n=1 Tax=Streptomyces rectiverticillatus TaxID=173860 RepID=UPI0015C3E809|nr:GNAT family N-acetyltransferase [Streptomyces rectiverticillatus]QLE71880.1 GNAT family N-acetyltransferase [Streptomyces rectiverticillatus]
MTGTVVSPSPRPWVVAPQPVRSAEAVALMRDYMTEVADRWFLLYEGRTTTPEEVEGYVAEEPHDTLAPPEGVLLIARRDGEPMGCLGLRWFDRERGTAELKRMFVRSAARGLGAAPALLAAAEAVAREWGAERIVLDTRKDLVEAIALYARHGFASVPRYNTPEDNPYAEVWMGKELRA